jgi:hypothetical protein
VSYRLQAALRPGLDSRLEPGDVPALACAFAYAEECPLLNLSEDVRRLALSGPVAVWGGGGKGATLVNSIDLERQTIRCVVDVNPN